MEPKNGYRLSLTSTKCSCRKLLFPHHKLVCDYCFLLYYYFRLFFVFLHVDTVLSLLFTLIIHVLRLFFLHGNTAILFIFFREDQLKLHVLMFVPCVQGHAQMKQPLLCQGNAFFIHFSA